MSDAFPAQPGEPQVRPEDEAFMRLALEEAQAAADAGEVPVGAVAVLDGEVVGRQRNRKEAYQDPTAHAEILLLRDVSAHLGRWRMPDVTIYCTMEPCAMCAGAMVQARLGRLVYAVPDLRAGAAGSVFEVLRAPALNHQVAVEPGVLAPEAKVQLDAFFRGVRERQARERTAKDADPGQRVAGVESGMKNEAGGAAREAEIR